jgi:hypothetical protein
LATKRNQVEERIFFLRDKIRESPDDVGLQSDVAMREKLYEVLKNLEDWLLYSDEVRPFAPCFVLFFFFCLIPNDRVRLRRFLKLMKNLLNWTEKSKKLRLNFTNI